MWWVFFGFPSLLTFFCKKRNFHVSHVLIPFLCDFLLALKLLQTSFIVFDEYSILFSSSLSRADCKQGLCKLF